MQIKFPDPDRPPPSDPAVLQIYYFGELDEKKSKAVEELLREYDAKSVRSMEDTNKHTFVYSVPRKYVVHAVRKLKVANFSVIEGLEYGTARTG